MKRKILKYFKLNKNEYTIDCGLSDAAKVCLQANLLH